MQYIVLCQAIYYLGFRETSDSRIRFSKGTLVNLSNADKNGTKGILEAEVKGSIDRVQSFKLVDQAMRLQHAEGGDLAEVEKCLKMALDLDPSSLEALQEAAHFYDAVEPDAAKAQQYALACCDRAAQIISEMEQILREKGSEKGTQRKTPAPRHIGGIIGPY